MTMGNRRSLAALLPALATEALREFSRVAVEGGPFMRQMRDFEVHDVQSRVRFLNVDINVNRLTQDESPARLVEVVRQGAHVLGDWVRHARPLVFVEASHVGLFGSGSIQMVSDTQTRTTLIVRNDYDVQRSRSLLTIETRVLGCDDVDVDASARGQQRIALASLTLSDDRLITLPKE